MNTIKYPIPHMIIQFTVRKFSVHTPFSEVKEEINRAVVSRLHWQNIENITGTQVDKRYQTKYIKMVMQYAYRVWLRDRKMFSYVNNGFK